MDTATSASIPDPVTPAPEKRGKAASRAEPTLSPVMRQYQQFKTQYPGYVLFFRMGDFYEMFWEDAKTAAKTLGVTLTSRNKGAADEIPMAGVPFHAG
jgi:DNA mismatch repair protein MutS